MVNPQKYKKQNQRKYFNDFLHKYPDLMEKLYAAYCIMYSNIISNDEDLAEMRQTWFNMIHPIVYLLDNNAGKILTDWCPDPKIQDCNHLFITPFMPEYIYLLYSFCIEHNIKAMLYNMQDDKFKDKLVLLSLFEDVKNYDIIFVINANYYMSNFLIDYGIEQCTKYCSYICLDEQSTNTLDVKSSDKNNTSFTATNNHHIQYDFNNPLYLKEDKIGFDLYDNLREWKKEVIAPTRDDPEYKKMKKRVRQRDNNTCQCCGYHSDKKTHHNLEVHHIFGYKDHLDYRVEDKNCVVLCQDCHKKYHSLYGRKDVAPDSFMKFIRDYNSYTNKSKQTTLI